MQARVPEQVARKLAWTLATKRGYPTIKIAADAILSVETIETPEEDSAGFHVGLEIPEPWEMGEPQQFDGDEEQAW